MCSRPIFLSFTLNLFQNVLDVILSLTQNLQINVKTGDPESKPVPTAVGVQDDISRSKY
jgi:hypothetical protein